MKQVTIHQAKTHLSRLIQEALAGEEIVIARGNQPVVRLVAVESARSERTPGALAGFITSMAEDFDRPLDDFQSYME